MVCVATTTTTCCVTSRILTHVWCGCRVIGYLGLLVVLVCLAKSCDACCCQVCNVVCISILVVNVLFLCFVAIFGSSGWYLRTVQNDDQLITFSPYVCGWVCVWCQC